MKDRANRIKILEGPGSLAPALVREWVLWRKGVEWIPGMAVRAPEERLEAANAEVANRKSLSTVSLEVLQEVWGGERPRS